MLAEFLTPIKVGTPTLAGHAVTLGYLETNYAPLASPALTGTPTAPTAAAGTDSTQLATTAFVKTATDAAIAGVDWKDVARVATDAALPAHTRTGNVLTASANGALTVDGVAVAAGDRVLVKDEGTGTHLENGLYTVTATGDAMSPWSLTRAADMDEAAEFTKMTIVPIKNGTANAGRWFYISATSADPVVVNTSTITFSAWTGTTYTADGDGIALAGTTFSLELDGTTLSKSAAGLKVADLGIGSGQIAAGAVTAPKKATYTTKFGNGAASSFAIAHNLGFENCKVVVKRRSDNNLVGCIVALTDANTVTLSGFDCPPAADALEVAIEAISARAA